MSLSAAAIPIESLNSVPDVIACHGLECSEIRYSNDLLESLIVTNQAKCSVKIEIASRCDHSDFAAVPRFTMRGIFTSNEEASLGEHVVRILQSAFQTEPKTKD